MDMTRLRTFCLAAKLRSISKAAEALKIGQPTASGHIQSLESEFAVTLFDRSQRPIRLTEAGARLFVAAGPLMEQLEDLVREMRPEVPGSVPGSLINVAAVPTIVSHKLPAVVDNFRRKYPSIQIAIFSYLSTRIIELVASRKIDLGVATSPVEHPGIEFQELFPFDYVVVAQRDHPIVSHPSMTLEDIAYWPLILVGPKTSRVRTYLEAELRRRNLRYTVAVQADNVHSAMQYVQRGVGIAISLSYSVNVSADRMLGVVSARHLLPSGSVGIVTRKGEALSDSVKQFKLALIRELRVPEAHSSRLSGRPGMHVHPE
jgi:LysR family carnitine catabolism transcriptional activator